MDALQSSGRYYLLRREVIQELQLTPQAFKSAASRLIAKRRIQRVRGDFFIIVPLEYQKVGAPPADWFINDYMVFQNVEYYVGILTAAAVHGASHQQPMAFQVITSKIMRDITIGQVRIQFHYKKIIEPSLTVKQKTHTGYMNVSNLEVTVCDLIRYISNAGQINNVANILIELADKINSEALISYVENNHVEISHVQRLGYLIDYLKLDVPLCHLIEYVQNKSPRYRLLVTGSKSTAIKDLKRCKKWKIFVNETVEPDV